MLNCLWGSNLYKQSNQESQKLTNLLVDGDARELVPVRVDGDGGRRNLLLRRRRVHDLFNQSGGRLV